MAWQIIYDPELNVAALVGSDPPVALGPIAQGDPGEDPRLILQEFAGILEPPADEWPTWKLFDEWANYIRAITEMAEQELERQVEAGERPAPDIAQAIQSGAVSDPQGADSPTAPEGDQSSPDGQDGPTQPGESLEAGDAGAGEAGEVPADGEAPSDQELADRLAAVSTPAKAGLEECWMCHGELKIDGPGGQVECPVCHGEGRTPVEATV